MKRVTASQIGNAAFCPYQLYLKEQGVKPDNRLEGRFDRGNKAHHEFNKSKKPSVLGLPGIVLTIIFAGVLLAFMAFVVIGVFGF